MAGAYCKNIEILSAGPILFLCLTYEHSAFGGVDFNLNEMANGQNAVPDVVGTRRSCPGPAPHTKTDERSGGFQCLDSPFELPLE